MLTRRAFLRLTATGASIVLVPGGALSRCGGARLSVRLPARALDDATISRMGCWAG